ncbi:unnamed protein product [Rhodiola kirilowii]
MANLVFNGNRQTSELDQVLTSLKKGAHLLKYGRKGKPKFYPFRLSSDESSLIWVSNSGERSLKLSTVSKIVPGQRTAVFQRFLRPDKDYLSFSLIYNYGKRSLDLICKDKVEAETWIAGLQELIVFRRGGRSKIDGWSEGGLYLEDNKELKFSSPTSSSTSAPSDFRPSNLSTSLDTASSSTSAPTDFRPSNLSTSLDTTSSPNRYQPDSTKYSERSYVEKEPANMQAKNSNSDVLRVSVSSAPSTSSHGSVPDDCDALGDVYMWGEVISDDFVKVEPQSSSNVVSARVDVLLPRPLEANIVLDVHHIACGVRHAAIVTRQGELFTWGEESGGQLGHGVCRDIIQPCLVESLSANSIDFAACGQFHSCAVTMTGELYTWGNGAHNVGLLGHGNDVSHWIPKRVSGSLEGLQVASVACGPWHTALITTTGQLFTFGDGTFGVLGHGDRVTVSLPREVESLSGLRTIAVACGVWHTAAVVEVIVAHSSSSITSGKLFTWGDGDKNRLGHGDKEPRLEPTCVPALIDYDFSKIACGHSLTVGLTTSGNVFTMGSTVYGQLGNPLSDGKFPTVVEDKLAGESVEEIACGAYHTAVLTSRNEVYSWGKGANGRLGHGDTVDRKTPTLVEALKDRHVKYIACGSNYSAAICLHKWVSGAEQSQCSTCRQAFGFTRKRHNCYNCGLVHCHSCSSKKAIRAAMAPNPSKPYRVCDSCYVKLSKVLEMGGANMKNVVPRFSGENRDRPDKSELRLLKSSLPTNMDLIKLLDNKAAKQGKKNDTFLSVPTSHTPSASALQLKDASSSTTRNPPKSATVQSRVNSRSMSPMSRKPSPPRSATPVPTISGLSFSKNVTESLQKTNELLSQEVEKLRAQVEGLRLRCEFQELELQKSQKKAQQATILAAEESARSKAAKEVIRSLTLQLKDLAERLPLGSNEALKQTYIPNILEQHEFSYPDGTGDLHSRSNSAQDSVLDSPIRGTSQSVEDTPRRRSDTSQPNWAPQTSIRKAEVNGRLSNGTEGVSTSTFSSFSEHGTKRGSDAFQDGDSMKSTDYSAASNSNQVEAEWIEQYEPGVYLTLVAFGDGTRDLKRVRFSRRRFGEHQAESWWSENREKVYERYNVHVSEKSVSARTPRGSEASFSQSSIK